MRLLRTVLGLALTVAGLLWIGFWLLLIAWGTWQETTTTKGAAPLFAGMFALGALAVIFGVCLVTARIPSRPVAIAMGVVLVASLATLALPFDDRAGPVNDVVADAYTERTEVAADPNCRWSNDEAGGRESWLCEVELDEGFDHCVATVSEDRRDRLVSFDCCSWSPGENFGGVLGCA